MEQRIHRGALSGREEFFYPDMPVGHLPQGLRLAMPRNGRPGVQLLLETDAGQLDASLESDAFVPEFFCMKAVPWSTTPGTAANRAARWFWNGVRPVSRFTRPGWRLLQYTTASNRPGTV